MVLMATHKLLQQAQVSMQHLQLPQVLLLLEQLTVSGLLQRISLAQVHQVQSYQY